MPSEPPVDREAEHARAAGIVAVLFGPDLRNAETADALAGFDQLLRDGRSDILRCEVARYLGAHDPLLRTGVRVLEHAARSGYTLAGLDIADRLLEHFERAETLVDFRLRFLLALARWHELVAECDRALSQEMTSVHLAFRVVLSLARMADEAEEDVRELQRDALAMFCAVVAKSREEPLWWARYHREVGNVIGSLKSYGAFLENAPERNAYRPAALRESAELALTSDRWGRDAPFLLQAAGAGVAYKMPWRARAAMTALGQGLGEGAAEPLSRLPGSAAYSHVHDAIGTPESAFDYLIDEVLPERTPYEPRDALLMIGTSLGAGGMERIFANSYRAVKASRVFEHVSMALLNFESPGPTAFYLPETGAEASEINLLHTLEVPGSPVDMLPLALARRVWRAHQLIQRERPRVIHAWNDLAGIVAAFAGLLAGCPRIFVHFHHMRAINLSTDRNLIRSYPSCYRRLLHRPEIELLFVADASAQDYADWWCVEPSVKFKRLYNGFTPMDATSGARETLRRDMGIAPDAPVLGTVFRFDPVKQPWLWMDAARRVAEQLPQARFIMVGSGALLDATQAQAARLGLSERVHFAGQVRNVGDYLACLDVFMLTSRVEGLPNSLVEAQLAGVPVVSTDVGGARETFVPGVTGRLVDVHTPEALAGAAVECLTDDAWRAEAKAKARAMANRRFGIDHYLKSLIALYGGA